MVVHYSVHKVCGTLYCVDLKKKSEKNLENGDFKNLTKSGAPLSFGSMYGTQKKKFVCCHDRDGYKNGIETLKFFGLAAIHFATHFLLRIIRDRG